MMTDINLSVGECLICKSYFMSNINLGYCIYCGAVTDEEYIKVAEDSKADKNYEIGERNF